MNNLYDNFCPFCDTGGKLFIYAERTSLFDTLYRCEYCYEVFDQRGKEIQELKARETRRRKKEEKEAFLLEEEPASLSKKRWTYGLFWFLMAVLLFAYLK